MGSVGVRERWVKWAVQGGVVSMLYKGRESQHKARYSRGEGLIVRQVHRVTPSLAPAGVHVVFKVSIEAWGESRKSPLDES